MVLAYISFSTGAVVLVLVLLEGSGFNSLFTKMSEVIGWQVDFTALAVQLENWDFYLVLLIAGLTAKSLASVVRYKAEQSLLNKLAAHRRNGELDFNKLKFGVKFASSLTSLWQLIGFASVIIASSALLGATTISFLMCLFLLSCIFRYRFLERRAGKMLAEIRVQKDATRTTEAPTIDPDNINDFTVAKISASRPVLRLKVTIWDSLTGLLFVSAIYLTPDTYLAWSQGWLIDTLILFGLQGLSIITVLVISPLIPSLAMNAARLRSVDEEMQEEEMDLGAGGKQFGG